MAYLSSPMELGTGMGFRQLYNLMTTETLRYLAVMMRKLLMIVIGIRYL